MMPAAVPATGLGIAESEAFRQTTGRGADARARGLAVGVMPRESWVRGFGAERIRLGMGRRYKGLSVDARLRCDAMSPTTAPGNCFWMIRVTSTAVMSNATNRARVQVLVGLTARALPIHCRVGRFCQLALATALAARRRNRQQPAYENCNEGNG